MNDFAYLFSAPEVSVSYFKHGPNFLDLRIDTPDCAFTFRVPPCVAVAMFCALEERRHEVYDVQTDDECG